MGRLVDGLCWFDVAGRDMILLLVRGDDFEWGVTRAVALVFGVGRGYFAVWGVRREGYRVSVGLCGGW